MTKKKSIFLKVACFMLALGLAIIPLFSFKNKEVAKADVDVELKYKLRL